MDDPDAAWQEARRLEREWRAIEDLRGRGVLDERACEARWNAALGRVPPEAFALAARFLVWREEQRLDREREGR